MERQVRVGVGCLVWKDGKFLLLQRSGIHGKGTWAPPGGHLEFGEEWEECATREVFEETSMKIENVRLITVTNDIHTTEGKHYVDIIMESDWVSGIPTIREPDKFSKLAWHTYKNMPNNMFLPWINLRKLKPELFI